MFTGIIESMGRVVQIRNEKDNTHITIETPLAGESYIDQSIAHNGVCLTVVKIIESNAYVVTAIKETLDKSNLGSWAIGTMVNLERSMLPDKRLDGHFVQGHVDTILQCIDIEDANGSWFFTFELPDSYKSLVVDKGSVCINGTSLTVIKPGLRDDKFQVAIIPYTYDHTNFKHLKIGDYVNIEFDILGKYIAQHLALSQGK